MKTRWMAAVVVGLAMAAGSAWADKRLDDAVAKAEEQMRKAKDLRDKSPDEADRAMQDAIKTIQKVADQDAQNPEARLALGKVLLRAGKRDDAGAAFAQAVKLAPASPGPMRASILATAADFDLLHGSGAQALADADAAVKAEANAETLAVLARAQARAADPALALQTADRAIAVGAAVGAAHQARGEALLALGRSADAVASLSKAATLAPALVSARVSLVLALLLDGKTTAALEAARAATQADPQSAEALAVQGLAVAKATPGGWGAAIGDAQQGAFLDAKSPLVHWAVGQLFEQNNYDQAITAYQASVATDPGFCPAAAGLVQTTYRTGRDAAAMPWAQKLAPANSFCGPFQLALGEMLLRKEEYAKALPALEKAAKLLPDSADANYFLGLAYTRLGKISEATAPYARAVELKSADLDYKTAYGLALARGGEAQAGVDQLRSVVSTPGYNKSDAWINLGFALRIADRPAEAVTAYQKVVSAEPSNAPAAVGLAFALNDAKRWDDAIAAFKRASDLDPSVKAEAGIQTARAIVKKLIETKGRDVAPAQKAYNDAIPLASADNHTLVWVKEAIAAIIKGGGGPGGAPQEKTIDMVRLTACVAKRGRCPNAADRARAVAELKDAGRDGVPYITFALREDPDPDVRSAAKGALESLKGTACAAGAELKLIAAMECPSPCINCPPADVKRELELCDAIHAGRALGQRLVAACGLK